MGATRSGCGGSDVGVMEGSCALGMTLATPQRMTLVSWGTWSLQGRGESNRVRKDRQFWRGDVQVVGPYVGLEEGRRVPLGRDARGVLWGRWRALVRRV